MFQAGIQPSGSETLAWSSYTGALAKVDALRNGRAIDEGSKFIGEMLRGGFIVRDDVDKLAIYGVSVRRKSTGLTL
ncbi:MAG: hypothetical protein II877_12180 [Synergistaceae bacterium]|nr:hypothetical protein [Synergistaceae bacterium]